jgi:D-glycero-D-manno-heptose 1,7-bisphosphate phosphatase
MMAARPALFLDRDGVINVDYAYVHRKEDFHFVDGIFDLCREAKRLGYRVFVITNQAGIGRGYYTEQDFHDLTAWMQTRLREEGAEADAVYFSPYHPEHGIGAYKKESECRKPGPGMLRQAAAEFEIDFARSVLVGDKYSDVQAGVAAGVGCNLLFAQDGEAVPEQRAGITALLSSLREAIEHLHAAAGLPADSTTAR